MMGTLKAGDEVGSRYRVEDWVGAGGMQYVYKARDTYFDREVALKMPKEDAAVKRFEKSALVSARINHVNVAKTLDYFVDSSQAFLVEELVSGCDLSKLVPSMLPLIPPSTAARILHSLAKGLAASHHAGVIHRDLKPSNIMVVGGYRFEDIKITDFGIATMAAGEIGPWADGDEKGTQSKTILGAIPYMAPESLTDFKTSDRPADVWSIAAIVYELLGGEKPFGKGPASIARILVASPPPPPSQLQALQFRSLGNELYQILLRCLSRDPSKRPTADELVTECGALCYALDTYELGTISKVHKSWMGFIASPTGRDLMYHKDSFYGPNTRQLGDQLWFARHPGGSNDRAFPIVQLAATPT